MKNLNIAGAIIISSIIISATIFFTFSNEPLKTCMKIVMSENEDAYNAAKVCSGSK